MKHTKGPWKIEGIYVRGAPAFPDDAGYVACTIHRQFSEEEREDNAHLIASAPELLAACKALISNAVWDGKTREHGAANEYTVHRAVIEATQRAIARAEGRG